MKSIDLLVSSLGQISTMKIVSDDDSKIDNIKKYLELGGELVPSFDQGKFVGISLLDCICPRRKFRNKKNGKIYIVEAIVTNSTNTQDGQEMYLYCCEDNPFKRYVRNKIEFDEKFEQINQ